MSVTPNITVSVIWMVCDTGQDFKNDVAFHYLNYAITCLRYQNSEGISQVRVKRINSYRSKAGIT